MPEDPPPTEPLATRLRLAVEETLKEVANRPPTRDEHHTETRNWLHECRQAILDGNHVRYRESLSSLIEVVLTKLSTVLANSLGLTDAEAEPLPQANSVVLLSFHVSSVQLRKWFRVLHPSTAWSRTDYRGSEISFFENIYDWDSRHGHILTDPEMPSDLDAIFGADTEEIPNWNGKDAECRFRLCRGLWDVAYDLVRSPIFTLLVDHDLDKCDKSEQISQALEAFPRFRKRDRDNFAANLEQLGTAVKGLWPPDAKTSTATRARSFLLSFFYTIGRPRQACERIVASSVMPICATFNGTRLVKTGSLAAVIAGDNPTEVAGVTLRSKHIQPAAAALAHAVAEIEHRALFERFHDARVSITEEDAIRQACEVEYLPHSAQATDEVGYEHLRRLSRPLHEEIALRLVDQHYIDKTEKATWQEKCTSTRPGQCIELPDPLKVDKTIHKLLDECGIVGASRSYVHLVRDLAAAAATDDLKETRVIFLDSEPGCGKDMLAKLIHLFSVRAHIDSHSATSHPVFKQRVLEIFNNAEERFLKHLVCQDQKDESVTVHLVQKSLCADAASPSYRQARLFNYFTLNMAALTNEGRFFSELFGKYGNRHEDARCFFDVFGKRKEFREVELEVIGRCLLAHALSGTVFLDEFNTLSVKEWANVFLRLLEKPFEMEIPGRMGGPLRDSKMLVIFASNKTREELIEAGFNEAVVYRVTKTRIHIPPLRERPADIAVFVNALVRKHNENRAKEHRSEQIRRIDIQAMRLLCELRWPDNYRGVQGLMDDVLGDRIQRRIAYPELTFDEILHGLRRREAFQAAVSRGKTEVVEHTGIR